MRRVIFFLTVVLSLWLSAWTVLPQNPQVIRVGFYENPPKIYTDDNGAISGFWPELIRVIAAEHSWQIEWVPGTWNELLVMLDNHEIDILPDTLWTEPRAQKYAFNQETVLVSWTRVYTRPRQKIESLLDLEGKRIGALRGSANLEGPEGLRDLLTRLQLNAEIVEMDDYNAIFAALEAGQLDAAITNKDFGQLNESRYRVVRTPIIMQPVRILFAFPKDALRTPMLIQTIDQSLAAMKTDPNSAYYRLQDDYLGSRVIEEEKTLPPWVQNALLISGGTLLFLLAVGIVSRIQVRARTRALRESEVRLRNVIEQLSDGVSLTDEQGMVIVWNSRLEAITGLPAETMLGRPLWDTQFELLPADQQTPERRTQLEGSLRAFLETGQAPWAGKPLERSFTRPDGDTTFVEGITFPIQTRRGFMLGSVTRDITERTRAEHERDEARQLFQKMFEISPVAMSLSRIADRKVVEINEAHTRLLGYSREELLGVHAPKIDYWADPAERQKVFEMLQTEGRVANYPFTFRKQNGEPGRAVIFAEIIEQQGEKYVLSVMVDITELQRYRENLEELVAERTAELEQRNEDLRRFALLAADRELRMKELGEENQALRERLKAAGKNKP